PLCQDSPRPLARVTAKRYPRGPMRANTALPLTVLLFAASGVSANPTPESPGPGDAPVGNPVARQSRDDAWRAGPRRAAAPGTLPPGHFLIEPYVFDVIPRGHYDSDGTRISGPHANNYGSQSYVLYGLVDRVSVGFIPRFAYNVPSEG